MPDKYYQRIANEDNCSYIFDYARKKWQRKFGSSLDLVILDKILLWLWIKFIGLFVYEHINQNRNLLISPYGNIFI